MLIYSLRKIIENPPLPYSVLNPDTNSLSPSAKSKGVRFLSAIIDTSQGKITGIITMMQEQIFSIKVVNKKLKEKNIKIIIIMQKKKTPSYEIH